MNKQIEGMIERGIVNGYNHTQILQMVHKAKVKMTQKELSETMRNIKDRRRKESMNATLNWWRNSFPPRIVTGKQL